MYNLTQDNFLLYAIKNYDNPHMVISEFNEDKKRFNYIKKLFHRYRKSGQLKHQLILNHLIILYNVFGAEASTRLLFFKIGKEDYSTLKTYLILLNIMPDKIVGIQGIDIISSDIPVDIKVANFLRSL